MLRRPFEELTWRLNLIKDSLFIKGREGRFRKIMRNVFWTHNLTSTLYFYTVFTLFILYKKIICFQLLKNTKIVCFQSQPNTPFLLNMEPTRKFI